MKAGISLFPPSIISHALVLGVLEERSPSKNLLSHHNGGEAAVVMESK
jgi:hypothetical protein